MPESFIENLISAGIGILIGFFGSIGVSMWQNWSNKKEFRERLREELELVRSQIQENLDKGLLVPLEVFIDYYLNTKQDLVAKVDARTWESVIRAYMAIEDLREKREGIEQKSREKLINDSYVKSINAVEEAIRNLNDHTKRNTPKEHT